MKAEPNTWDAAASGVGTKTLAAGAAGTTLGWWASSEFIGLMGLALAIGGFAINWYYQRRRDRREQALYEKRMSE